MHGHSNIKLIKLCVLLHGIYVLTQRITIRVLITCIMYIEHPPLPRIMLYKSYCSDTTEGLVVVIPHPCFLHYKCFFWFAMSNI
jgi:hypothetical protein